MIAANARWVSSEAMEGIISKYMERLYDEKPITVRQCIQGLLKIVPYHKQLNQQIAESLLSLDLMSIRETMRKSVMTDILQVLLVLRDEQKCDPVEQYIARSLSGGLLDEKSKKAIALSLSKASTNS